MTPAVTSGARVLMPSQTGPDAEVALSAPSRAGGRPAAHAFAEALPANLRRLFRDAAGPLDLPPELAFLALEGVAPERLAAAAREAAAAGVSGEAALFGQGFSDDRYYRLLARHLGAPYLDRPLRLAEGPLDAAAVARTGFAPLAPNVRELRHVGAPSGLALRVLVGGHAVPAPGRGYRFAITTPRRLAALVRLRDGAVGRERIADGLANWDAALSARAGARAWQVRACAAVAAVGSAMLAASPAFATAASALLLFGLFGAAIAERLRVVAASASLDPDPPGPDLSDRDLPVYTVLVPLFREARVLPRLVAALAALDYPAAKLDIKLLLEAADRDTIAAVARLGLPAFYDVVVLGDGHPRTKPRALNAGLEVARGSLLVVYDAEDRPEPGQLRAAARRFAAAPPTLACLQARLAIDHPDDTWITRLCALEYAALFGAVKPGLARLGLPVPLGGTSNHFRVAALRRVNGWDAWNVTEDIDLGFRLARFGLSVGWLDSTTFEEAPLTAGRWLPQRARWLKGWMVTLIVHTRDPLRLRRELGVRAAASMLVSLVGTVASCLVGPPLFAVLPLALWRGHLLSGGGALPAGVAASSLALAAGGVAALVWPAALGLRRAGRLDLLWWCAALPAYLMLLCAAAWRALYELWRDPQGWHKTEHGLARRPACRRPAPARAGGPPRRVRPGPERAPAR